MTRTRPRDTRRSIPAQHVLTSAHETVATGPSFADAGPDCGERYNVRHVTVTVAILLLVLGVAQPAHAYLDANTGSLLLQLLLGGVAGLALVGKLFWHRLARFFGIRTAENDED